MLCNVQNQPCKEKATDKGNYTVRPSLNNKRLQKSLMALYNRAVLEVNKGSNQGMNPGDLWFDMVR